MGERELFRAGLLLWSLLLLALADAGVDSSCGGGTPHGTWEWQVLTKKNFSSQIRRHPQILLMVTVPWSGASRSLRKELVYLMDNRKEEFRSRKLMIVYMISEKMLADLLGSTDEITLFYYYHSVSYKYNGRFQAQNVLSAISYFLTLEHEEIPLKNLQTLEELHNFFLSTDKAVLLLEFCGWSAKLLNRQNNGNLDNPLASQNHSKNGLMSELITLPTDDTSFKPSLVYDNERDPVGISLQLTSSDVLHSISRPFMGSFFFSDGDYRFLKDLTGGSKIPSLVILDPLQQQHYIFPSDVEIDMHSLTDFINRFLNDSLTPHRRSAINKGTSRELPKPPFVNLDFHELDFVPQVTCNTFCEMVIGIKSCETETSRSTPMSENLGSAWKKDVLVLFTASWCGFCQRMELILHEVYRSLRSSVNSLRSQFKNIDDIKITEEKEEFVLDKLPSIVLMDCTNNDCGLALKPLGKKEQYPLLLLFPAENKSAITYGGDMSVISVFEFLESHGRNSDYLRKHKGYLWTASRMGSENVVGSHLSALSSDEKCDSAEDGSIEVASDAPVSADNTNPVESYESIDSDAVGIRIVVGSLLFATDKLMNTVPFENSTVLLVSADQDDGFQGVIINKRISWDIFKGKDKNLEPLRHSPLFYGGPVRLETLPLVSLARKATNGYTKVSDVYFGNPVATGLIIRKIKSVEVSPDDYWFFLGFSSWGSSQLFDELEEGAWLLSTTPIKYLDWPQN